MIYDGATIVVDGDTFTVRIERDTDMGEPWKEHDGHGVISEWTTRDKHPGERVLVSDGRSKRYYDIAATMVIAKRDGWGLSDEARTELEKKKGCALTAGEVVAAAVDADYQRMRAWCYDEWYWCGLSVVDRRTNEVIDSLWGIDGSDQAEYLEAEAMGMVVAYLEAKAKEQTEAAYWAARDTLTM